MNRKLAVPLVLSQHISGRNVKTIRTRILKEEEDLEDLDVLFKIAENRERLDRIMKEVEGGNDLGAADETKNELDYINASIQLELLEVTAELEEVPTSDDLFEQALA